MATVKFKFKCRVLYEKKTLLFDEIEYVTSKTIRDTLSVNGVVLLNP